MKPLDPQVLSGTLTDLRQVIGEEAYQELANLTVQRIKEQHMRLDKLLADSEVGMISAMGSPEYPAAAREHTSIVKANSAFLKDMAGFLKAIDGYAERRMLGPNKPASQVVFLDNAGLLGSKSPTQ